MRCRYLVYVIGRTGSECILCECTDPITLSEVVQILARMGVSGPAGFRIIRIDTGD